MPDPNPQSPHINVDEEYKSAIQPVVDNNMRTDILGPHFCRVLENHTPASDAVVSLIAKKVIADPILKKAIKDVVDERNGETKMKWMDRIIGIILGTIGTLVVGAIMWFMTQAVLPKTIPTPTPTPSQQPVVSN